MRTGVLSILHNDSHSSCSRTSHWMNGSVNHVTGSSKKHSGTLVPAAGVELPCTLSGEFTPVSPGIFTEGGGWARYMVVRFT